MKIVYCPVDHSDKTYALVAFDDSMKSSRPPFLTKEGDHIIVDPAQREDVSVGDFVLAKVDGQDIPTYRQLAEEAGKQFLQPVNKKFPPIHSDFTILGKVIFTGRAPRHGATVAT